MNRFITLISFVAMMFGYVPGTFAVVHTVQVGNFYFNPASINNVNPGDTIRWVWVAGSHTTTSSTIPAGAASWDELITSSNTTYEYIPVNEGTYNYVCTPHIGMGMVGNFTVVAAAPLTVTATADPMTICKGQYSWLHANPSGGTGTYTYAWISNPPGFNSDQQNVQVFPTVTTVYTVTVTSGTQNSSASVTVTVNNLPSAFAGNDTSYCVTVTQFTVSGTASGYSGVQWSTLGDGTFANGNTLTDTYFPGLNDQASFGVQLVLTAFPESPCAESASDTVHITLDPCTGIGNPDKEAIRVSVFPNPAQGAFQFSAPAGGADATVQIADMSGKMILEKKMVPGPDGFIRATVDLSGKPKGIYHLLVISGGKTGSTRILVN
jgi:plastocyanin